MSFLGFGDGDPHVQRIRLAYLERDPFPIDGLSDRQHDVLRMLAAAVEPVSTKELFYLFDGVERTWVDHSPGGLQDVLHKLARRGLVERAGKTRQGGYMVQVWQPTTAALRPSSRRVRRVAI